MLTSAPKVEPDGNPLVFVPDWDIPGFGQAKIWIGDALAIISGSGEDLLIRAGDEQTGAPTAALFEILEKLDGTLRPNRLNIPFFYLGALSYDFGRRLENIALNAVFYRLPEFFIVFPGNGWIWNEKKQQGWRFRSKRVCKLSEPGSPMESRPELASVSREEYRDKIDKIRGLITEGEVYQINYTIRFSRVVEEGGWQLFQKLYRENPAPYSVYLKMDRGELLSISPERFLHQRGDVVTTEPIKGTVKRGTDLPEDERLKKWLLQSRKNQAELNMIIDLLRNDLSRNCLPGSVKVLKRKELRSFANVHHLVGVVRGRLEKKERIWRLFRDAFPGGSITGCPKIAAMNYISNLEAHSRSYYTGSFFIRFPGWDVLDSNILIRTGILTGGQIYFQVGGGIVIDSDPEEEFRECVAKAASFLKVMGVEDASLL
ncbi:MAG: aminodeoxychorismate synthase component I [Calditrichia bacterium]